jgi:hypothetical protein
LVILTFIRRLLILLCIIGILSCLVMWMIADRNNGSGNTGPILGKLRISSKSVDERDKLAQKLKASGHTCETRVEDETRDKVKGYMVVGDFSDDLAKPVSDYLKNNNYSVTLKPDPSKKGWSQCLVGKAFTSKAQAESVVKKIKSELAVAFKAEPLYEKIPVKVQIILIRNIDEDTAKTLQEKYKIPADAAKWEQNP